MMNDYGSSPYGDTTGYGGYDNSYLMQQHMGGMGMNEMYENPYSPNPAGFPGTMAQTPQRNLKKVKSEKHQQEGKRDKKKKKGAASGGNLSDSRNDIRASEVL